MRSWERGAGLTLACGTGASATAVAAISSKRATSPVRIHMPGGEVSVFWSPGQELRMRGAATHVFEGDLDLEALR
jgi:diaminopimelate epimerase